MSFILTLISLMFVADLLWWAHAHKGLRALQHTKIRIVARQVLAVFMLLQIASLGWIIFGWFVGKPNDEALPKFLLILVFLWHFILLPIGVAFGTIGVLVRAVERIAHIWIVESPLPPKPDQGMTRRELLQTAAVAAPPLAAVMTAGVSLSQLSEFRVRHYDLALPQLPEALEGLKVAQVSDIHVGGFTSGQVLRRIVDMTNGLRADLVLLTGDLINHALADLAVGLDLVRRMDSRFGAFMCEGNHDLIESRIGFEDAVKKSGVPLLLNESTTLNIRGQALQLLGLKWGPSRNDVGIESSMKVLLPQLQPGAFPILLAHHPHAFDPAAAAEIPLTLSGHTHGGQLMASPNVGFGPMMFRYWSGLYEKGNSKLIVSNGVGNWFPLRVNAPAEIVNITLHRQR